MVTWMSTLGDGHVDAIVWKGVKSSAINDQDRYGEFAPDAP